MISIALYFLLPWVLQKFYQMQIKSAIAYHLTPVRLLLKKKKPTNMTIREHNDQWLPEVWEQENKDTEHRGLLGH